MEFLIIFLAASFDNHSGTTALQAAARTVACPAATPPSPLTPLDPATPLTPLPLRPKLAVGKMQFEFK